MFIFFSWVHLTSWRKESSMRAWRKKRKRTPDRTKRSDLTYSVTLNQVINLLTGIVLKKHSAKKQCCGQCCASGAGSARIRNFCRNRIRNSRVPDPVRNAIRIQEQTICSGSETFLLILHLLDPDPHSECESAFRMFIRISFRNDPDPYSEC
jgi:hypothetical protein